jgi:hypothetical protein
VKRIDNQIPIEENITGVQKNVQIRDINDDHIQYRKYDYT